MQALLLGVAERLFHHNMLFVPCKEDTALIVKVVREGDKDGIHIVHHFLVIKHDPGVRAKLLCHLFGTLGDDVADRGDLDPLYLVDVAGVTVHHTATANES